MDEEARARLTEARKRLITFFAVTIIACVLIMFLWMLIGTYINAGRRPRLSIQDLYVPALKNPNPTLFNATPLHPSILIDIKFKENDYSMLQTSYADLEMTVFYGVDRSFPVANHTLPRFLMDGRLTIHKGVAINAPGLPWEDAIRKVSGGLPVDLVVGLDVKYEDDECCARDECDWPEGMVWADVAVDSSGEKVSKKPIAFAYDRFNL